jgi:hypothetical protein
MHVGVMHLSGREKSLSERWPCGTVSAAGVVTATGAVPPARCNVSPCELRLDTKGSEVLAGTASHDFSSCL